MSQITEFIKSASPASYRQGYAKLIGLGKLFEIEKSFNDIISIKEGDELTAIGKIQPLKWDSNFFGFSCACVDTIYFGPDQAGSYESRISLSKKIVKEADRLGHKFVMCRITASDPLLANALEEVGFRICDILNIYVAKSVSANTEVLDQRSEASEILEHCIKGMKWGRIHQDPNIIPAMAHQFYLELTREILTQECHVTIVRSDGRAVGFAIGVPEIETSNFLNERFGVLWLIAIDPEFQGIGLGKKLFKEFLLNFSGLCDIVEIGTQSNNKPANEIYTQAGCQLVAQALTFHRWVS